MSRNTQYIPVGWEAVNSGRSVKAEFQVEDSEGWPGRVELQLVGFHGTEYGAATLTETNARGLIDALNMWLDLRAEATHSAPSDAEEIEEEADR